MSERRSIWGVTSGSYSDYQVVCLCETKDDAEAVALALRGDDESWHSDAGVEEFCVVDREVKKTPVLYMTTTLWDNGEETEAVDDRVTGEWPWDGLSALSWRWVRAPIHRNAGGRLNVSGTDHELVRKVFSEKRAMLKADPAMSMIEELTGGKS